MRSVHLFVYGTLQRGQTRHRILQQEIEDGWARYLGEATVSGFTLYDLGDFPVAVPGDGQIQGERYRISRDLLVGELDRMEGFPYTFDRTRVDIAEKPHWIYIQHQVPPGAVRLDSTRWKQQPS